MLDRHFDELARSIATDSTRRRLIRAIAAGTIGLAVAQLGAPAPVTARRRRCKEFGQQCNKDEACCAGKCSPKRICHCHHWQVRCDDRHCCPKDKPNCCN